jgi:hypothetical protein
MRRLVAGLLVAPLIGSAPFVAVATVLALTTSIRSDSPWWVEVAAPLYLLLWSAWPWYVAVAVVLLPVHLILQRYGYRRLLTYQLAFAVPAMLLFAWSFTSNVAIQMGIAPGFIGWTIDFLLAVAVASGFWALVVRRKAQERQP